jgi:hypothetical protein
MKIARLQQWLKEKEHFLLLLVSFTFAFEMTAFNVQSLYVFSFLSFVFLILSFNPIAFTCFLFAFLLLILKDFSEYFSLKQSLSISFFLSSFIISMKLIMNQRISYLRAILISCLIFTASSPFQLAVSSRVQGFYSEPGYLSELIAYVILPITALHWSYRTFKLIGILLIMLLPFTESAMGYIKFSFLSLMLLPFKDLRRPILICFSVFLVTTVVAFSLNTENYALRHLRSVLNKADIIKALPPKKIEVQEGKAFVNSGYMSDSYIDKIYLPLIVIKKAFSSFKVLGFEGPSEEIILRSLKVDESVLNQMKRIKKSDSLLNSWLAKNLALFGFIPLFLFIFLHLKGIGFRKMSLNLIFISFTLLFFTGGNFSNPRIAFLLAFLMSLTVKSTETCMPNRSL